MIVTLLGRVPGSKFLSGAFKLKKSNKFHVLGQYLLFFFQVIQVFPIDIIECIIWTYMEITSLNCDISTMNCKHHTVLSQTMALLNISELQYKINNIFLSNVILHNSDYIAANMDLIYKNFCYKVNSFKIKIIKGNC